MLPTISGSLTSSLGMHNSLWYPLSVKVSHLIYEGKVLDQYRTPLTHSHGGSLAVNRMSLTSCQDIGNLQ